MSPVSLPLGLQPVGHSQNIQKETPRRYMFKTVILAACFRYHILWSPPRPHDNRLDHKSKATVCLPARLCPLNNSKLKTPTLLLMLHQI